MIEDDIKLVKRLLMMHYGASEEQALEATHEAYIRIHKHEIQESLTAYWYTAAKNVYLRTIERDWYVELEEHHLPVSYQPEIVEETEIRKLDKIMEKLEPKEWAIIAMTRAGLSNAEMAKACGWKKASFKVRKSEIVSKIKSMLVLVLVLLATVTTLEAQNFELVRPAEFRYYVVVGQDTVATRSLQYKAIQDGMMYKCQHPDAQVTVQPAGIEVRGCPIPEPEIIYIDDTEIITDTVFVEVPGEVITDTVFVEVPTDTTISDTVYVQLRDTVLIGLNNVDWEHRIIDDGYQVTISGESDQVVSIRWGCTALEWSESHGVDEGRFSASFTTDCQQDFHFEVSTWTDGRRYEAIYRDQIPMHLFADDPEQEQPLEWKDTELWSQHWRDNATLSGDQFGITHHKQTSGSDLWILDHFGQFSFIDVRLQIDTGLHLRLLSNPSGASQDMYVSGGQLRYVRWLDGAPGDTRNYDELILVPFDYDPGLVWVRMRAGLDEVRIKAWQGSDEPEGWMIWDQADGATPGYLGFGSHSVQDRRIENLEILDATPYTQDQ